MIKYNGQYYKPEDIQEIEGEENDDGTITKRFIIKGKAIPPFIKRNIEPLHIINYYGLSRYEDVIDKLIAHIKELEDKMKYYEDNGVL